jgi:hypothetical protein
MHRFVSGAKPDEKIDHRNGNTLDNRRENLRRASGRQNSQNQRCARPGRKAPYKGIFWHGLRRKWCARIAAGKQRSCGRSRVLVLGYFATPEAAAMAHDRAAIKHFGEFASTNFPREKLEEEGIDHDAA